MEWVKKPTPSQISLIKNAKYHFLLWKKFKNTENAQLWLLLFNQYVVQYCVHGAWKTSQRLMLLLAQV